MFFLWVKAYTDETLCIYQNRHQIFSSKTATAWNKHSQTQTQHKQHWQDFCGTIEKHLKLTPDYPVCIEQCLVSSHFKYQGIRWGLHSVKRKIQHKGMRERDIIFSLSVNWISTRLSKYVQNRHIIKMAAGWPEHSTHYRCREMKHSMLCLTIT